MFMFRGETINLDGINLDGMAASEWKTVAQKHGKQMGR
jgi:hypothetical protein